MHGTSFQGKRLKISHRYPTPSLFYIYASNSYIILTRLVSLLITDQTFKRHNLLYLLNVASQFTTFTNSSSSQFPRKGHRLLSVSLIRILCNSVIVINKHKLNKISTKYKVTKMRDFQMLRERRWIAFRMYDRLEFLEA